MKSFKDLLLESAKEYEYRIKVLGDLSEKQLDALEFGLKKYDLITLTKPKKTIIQKTPLDFKDVDYGEVSIIDIVTSLPASTYVLQQEAAFHMNLPEKFVVVRSPNEPVEYQNDLEVARAEVEQEAKDGNLKVAPKLSTDSEYPEEEHTESGENFYGDKYNDAFKVFLAQMAATRKDPVVKAQSDLNELKSSPVEQNTEDFNKDIKDAPKVHNKWDSKGEPKFDNKKDITGNFNATEMKLSFPFQKPNGKKKVIKKSIADVRKI